MPEFNEDSGGFKMKGFSLHQGTQKYTQAKNAAREAAIKGAKELSAESIAKTVESPNKYHTEGHTPKKQVGPKVDPDAPGTPGTPGYEPPVRRSDFEEGSEQQKMFDRNQAKRKAKAVDKKFKDKEPMKQVKRPSPAKSHKPGHKDQQGPIPKKNIKLQKGEHPATWVYPGGNKQERINDYEDRAEFAREDAFSSKGKKKEMHKKTAKNLEREAEIIRDRRRNTRKNAK